MYLETTEIYIVQMTDVPVEESSIMYDNFGVLQFISSNLQCYQKSYQ